MLAEKALYGLKQAPRAWYEKINTYLLSSGFNKSHNEATLYTKKANHELLIISLYVDDVLLTGSNVELMENFKVEMKNHFEMSDLGLMTHFLGIEVLQSRQGIFTCQENYIKKVLEKFGMENRKKVETPLAADMKIMKEDVAEKINPTTYRSLIGCLLYITATRPDILFATSVLSRYMSSRSALHFKIAKRVLRFLKGTANLGMLYEKSHDNKFVDCCDSDWGGCLDDMKSTSSYIFQLGKCVIS